VVNQQDTVRIPDREDALRFVAERLREFRFADVSLIFSISARLGLEAKQAQDALQLEESGIPCSRMNCRVFSSKNVRIRSS
jgi:hypothetical protein